MTITHEEYASSSNANVLTDLATKIAAHPNWDDITLPAFNMVTTASLSSSATTVTVASTANLRVGDIVQFTGGTSGNVTFREVVSIVSGTQFTIPTGLGATEAAGTGIASHGYLLKTTNDDGAQLVVYIARGPGGEHNRSIVYKTWRTHTGAVGGGVDASVYKYVYYHNLAAFAGNVIHAVLSLSQNHLFVSLEGPYANEANATSTAYGSLRNYMFVDSIVPYRDTDPVDAVACWGVVGADINPQIADLLWRGEVSRNYDNNASWGMCRFATVTMPHFASSAATTIPSYSSIDAKEYLWPYVVVEDNGGLRGRLKSLFFVGLNRTTYAMDPVVNPGRLIELNGVVYKTHAVHKGDGGNVAGGGLGYYSGTASSAEVFGSPIVAIPYADAA